MDEEYLVKDRFQDILLAALYNSVDEAGLLVFKGGTAIRKIYGIDRYSDDLDFNLNLDKLDADAERFVYRLRDRCVATLSPLYDARMHIHEGGGPSYGIDTALKDSNYKTVKIHIEISTEKVCLPSSEKRVVTADATYFASVMDMNEMLAEKVRAVYTRRNIDNIARDLVDIAFLKKLGGKFDLELVDKKLKSVKHSSFSIGTFSARIKLITDGRWERDLGRIMKRLPDRVATVKQVMDFVRKW